MSIRNRVWAITLVVLAGSVTATTASADERCTKPETTSSPRDNLANMASVLTYVHCEVERQGGLSGDVDIAITEIRKDLEGVVTREDIECLRKKIRVLDGRLRRGGVFIYDAFDDLEHRLDGRLVELETWRSQAEPMIKDHGEQIATHTRRLDAHDEQIDAAEYREASFRIEFVAGAGLGYQLSAGGDTDRMVIILQPDTKEERPYLTSRFALRPFVGIAPQYGGKLYTDLTAGLLADTSNAGLGLRLQVHVGGFLGKYGRWSLGVTGMYEFVQAASVGKGGTYSVIDSRYGGGLYARLRLARSKNGALTLNAGAEIMGLGGQASLKSDGLGFGGVAFEGFLEVAVGRARTPLELQATTPPSRW